MAEETPLRLDKGRGKAGRDCVSPSLLVFYARRRRLVGASRTARAKKRRDARITEP